MKSIRVLQRAAAVLRALDRHAGMPLKDLHRQTGIAKPTLLRLLATLEEEQLVWRAMADGRYRSTVSLAKPVAGWSKQAQLADAAGRHLSELRKRVVWPSDLLVRRGFQMVLIESSRRDSPLLMHRDAIGFRIDMRVSAAGRSYLAFCPDTERERILAHFLRYPEKYPHSRALDRQTMDEVLAQTRSRGYGVRDAHFGNLGWSSKEYDRQLAAIAVPVMAGPKVIACINLVWPRRFDSEAVLARKHLDDLRRAAAAIAADVL